jgi:hypothetical protein
MEWTPNGVRQLAVESNGLGARILRAIGSIPWKALGTDLLQSKTGQTALVGVVGTLYLIGKAIVTGKAPPLEMAGLGVGFTYFAGVVAGALGKRAQARRQAFLQAMRVYFENPGERRFSDVYEDYKFFLDPGLEGQLRPLTPFQALGLFSTASRLGLRRLEEATGAAAVTQPQPAAEGNLEVMGDDAARRGARRGLEASASLAFSPPTASEESLETPKPPPPAVDQTTAEVHGGPTRRGK